VEVGIFVGKISVKILQKNSAASVVEFFAHKKNKKNLTRRKNEKTILEFFERQPCFTNQHPFGNHLPALHLEKLPGKFFGRNFHRHRHGFYLHSAGNFFRTKMHFVFLSFLFHRADFYNGV
jgi:hypothetical protein